MTPFTNLYDTKGAAIMDGWYRVIVIEHGRELPSKPFSTWGQANDEFTRLEKLHEDDPGIDVQLWVRES